MDSGLHLPQLSPVSRQVSGTLRRSTVNSPVASVLFFYFMLLLFLVCVLSYLLQSAMLDIILELDNLKMILDQNYTLLDPSL
jgi:membrane-associated PAP2 superfamily phosphatase